MSSSQLKFISFSLLLLDLYAISLSFKQFNFISYSLQRNSNFSGKGQRNSHNLLDTKSEGKQSMLLRRLTILGNTGFKTTSGGVDEITMARSINDNAVGLKSELEKASPSLGRSAIYIKDSRINGLPRVHGIILQIEPRKPPIFVPNGVPAVEDSRRVVVPRPLLPWFRDYLASGTTFMIPQIDALLFRANYDAVLSRPRLLSCTSPNHSNNMAMEVISSNLNPEAPIFVPSAYRAVEDFSDEWWFLVHSSPWFRDYWLRERFHDPQIDPPFPENYDPVLPDLDFIFDSKIINNTLKWRNNGRVLAETPRYAQKAPKIVNVKVSPRTIQQPR
ncbi:hypothetical protein TEA_023304 [Camellia sinensis var. sinensis]|uniref:Ataxin-2 C-terminal domain-containing protein n=1 Tax=Camellia sinensis var. sinensis TaxID=542762 RepID=A0A4S4DFQ5_CAMSN|nr:hypothetical protein TEA_023304 [Camellia sinensis var. sinensis]